jgi:KaiC/GvpD/RAD55 family RecA-like ATPase
MPRLSTGIDALDAQLGGGLLPGTLTVIVGATGIGKTQLGLQFAEAGERQEGRRGVLFDMSSRGDPQSHDQYTHRMFNWNLSKAPTDGAADLDQFFAAGRRDGEYLHVFEYIRMSRRWW